MTPLPLTLALAAVLPLAQVSATPVPGRAPLQLTSLAAATCLEASGQLRPDQRARLLALQGRYWGWPRNWEQGIDPHRVVAMIERQGGCASLLRDLRRARLTPSRPPTRPGERPRSELEGFGLAPYR